MDRFLPGENPLGQRLGIFWGQTLVGEIVGVVGNVRYRSLAEEAEPTFYWPEAQRPLGDMQLVIRTAGRPVDWAGVIRGAVRSLDPKVPVAEVETLSEVVSLSTSRTRFSLVLLGACAGIALILAAVGPFGVMAYSVAQRTQEIGVRMALGAKPAGIVGMVLRDGMTLAITGLGAAAVAAIGLTRFIAAELYGVKLRTRGASRWPSVCCWALPFSRPIFRRVAAKVNPMVALRYE